MEKVNFYETCSLMEQGRQLGKAPQINGPFLCQVRMRFVATRIIDLLAHTFKSFDTISIIMSQYHFAILSPN